MRSYVDRSALSHFASSFVCIRFYRAYTKPMVNIILDLDETLVHTIVSKTPRKDLERHASFSFQFSPQGDVYYVYKRPGLREFLDTVFTVFKRVGIWTAADRQYAKFIVKKIMTYQQIMKLDFIYSRDFCESDHIGVVKPLAKIYTAVPLWRSDETIMLDNSPQVMKQNPRNGIVAPDYAEPHLDHDIYLPLLSDIFKESLPKCRVYQFVERVNHVMPYIVSLYDLDKPPSKWGVDIPEIKRQLKLSCNLSSPAALSPSTTTAAGAPVLSAAGAHALSRRTPAAVSRTTASADAPTALSRRASAALTIKRAPTVPAPSTAKTNSKPATVSVRSRAN